MFRSTISRGLWLSQQIGRGVRYDSSFNSAEMHVKPRLERCVNKVTLLGRVGQDPVQKGDAVRPVVQFTLATSEVYRDRRIGHEGEYKEKTLWHRISVFYPESLRDLILRVVRKGSRIYVQGRLDYSEYTDKQGYKVFATTVIADDIIFLSTRKQDESPAEDDDDEGDI
ncbi:single-stranded DNA-binding protein, mitochondrial-like [Ptychodera flava]|uniref:single-stranded DNA-binding protein, mitochondrial-like n=1 Tax=Ptychodera flava TaxID=63121 RepID=UPI00396A84C3